MTSVVREGLMRHADGSSDIGSLLFTGEQAKVRIDPIDAGAGVPFPGCLVPPHASITRSRPNLRRPILSVLPVRGDAKIIAATIEFTAVDVVAVVSLSDSRQGKQFPMQEDRVSGPFIRLRCGASGVPLAGQMPRPLSGPFGIGSVNNGVGANYPDAVVQGNPCDVTINDGVGWRSASRAWNGTEVRSQDPGWLARKGRAAGRTGKMYGHRDNSSVSSPGRYNDAGAYCVNYTRSFLVQEMAAMGPPPPDAIEQSMPAPDPQSAEPQPQMPQPILQQQPMAMAQQPMPPVAPQAPPPPVMGG